MNTFKAFDKDGNGTISKEELIDGYLELYKGKMNEADILREVDEILEKVDLDRNGLI